VKSISALVFLFMAVPAFAFANHEGDWFEYWASNSPYQAAIQALGSEPVPTFPIPVLLGVERAQITANFGDVRGGGTRTHEGLDIMALAGTPVVSPTDAVVIQAGNGSDSGLYVRTVNPGGEQFVYMHLKEIATGISEGVVLKRGDVLGYVGNTGNASGGAPHLHFEVRKNGPTDPLPRISQSFSLNERMTGVAQALERTNDASLADTLASNFKSTFSSAVSQGVSVTQTILSKINLTTASAQTSTTMSPTGAFTRNLERGMRGEDVRALQVFLNSKGFIITTAGGGSPGQETTLFGALTEKALAKFQASNGITPAIGYFGPKTRAFVNK
jgi:peptidoglycan LD-endopeptidase LytH